MKLILIPVIFLATFFSGCFIEKDLQADIRTVQLVKIDTIYRFTVDETLVLTWKCKDNKITFKCYVPMGMNGYRVGIEMPAILRK